MARCRCRHRCRHRHYRHSWQHRRLLRPLRRRSRPHSRLCCWLRCPVRMVLSAGMLVSRRRFPGVVRGCQRTGCTSAAVRLSQAPLRQRKTADGMNLTPLQTRACAGVVKGGALGGVYTTWRVAWPSCSGMLKQQPVVNKGPCVQPWWQRIRRHDRPRAAVHDGARPLHLGAAAAATLGAHALNEFNGPSCNAFPRGIYIYYRFPIAIP